MSVPDLCPSCLTELPPDYPFDHVAIDLALAGNTAVLERMPRAERVEMVRVAYARGLTESQVGLRVHRSITEIRRWLAPRKERVRGSKHDATVRELWEQDLTDRQIASRIGKTKTMVFYARKRLKLPARHLPIHLSQTREVAAA